MGKRWALGLVGLGIAGSAWATVDATQTDFSVFKFERAEEYVSRASCFLTGGTLTTQNKHLLSLVFICNFGGDPPPPTDHSDYTTHSFDFWVDPPTEVGTIPAPVVSQGALHIGPGPSQEFEIHLVAPDQGIYALPGGNVLFHVKETDYLHTWNSGSQGYDVTFTWTQYDATYGVLKELPTDASIDTRKAYGEPNTAGVLPGDPNADARNVQFGSWCWKGGLFVGDALWTSNDLSGLARTQFYTSLPADPPFARATLTLMDLGKSSKFPGNVSLGVYAPLPTDPYYDNTNEGNVVWGTRWSTIQPETVPGQQLNFSKDPISTVSFPDSYSGFAYANWALRVPAGNTQVLLTKLCLAMTDETVVNVWRYFASREYQALFTHYEVPQIDSQPRVWIVQLTALTVTQGP